MASTTDSDGYTDRYSESEIDQISTSDNLNQFGNNFVPESHIPTYDDDTPRIDQSSLTSTK